jgi:hypothetical protein
VTFKLSHSPSFRAWEVCRRVASPHLDYMAESFADLQTCYERLWQSPSSNDKHNQRNTQNDVDDHRFQQLLFRV